jgi:hypothetical protein
MFVVIVLHRCESLFLWRERTQAEEQGFRCRFPSRLMNVVYPTLSFAKMTAMPDKLTETPESPSGGVCTGPCR